MICGKCGLDIDPSDETNYHEVTSWVSGPKLDGPVLREQTGWLAHKKCIENLIAGQAPDQPELKLPEPPRHRSES